MAAFFSINNSRCIVSEVTAGRSIAAGSFLRLENAGVNEKLHQGGSFSEQLTFPPTSLQL
jgi:hypothetical protein